MPPGVPTVLIGGMPAACVGDMVTCVGPPDTIAPPGCPTVLIGAGGGGGGGAGMGGSGKASLDDAEGSEAAEPEESHFLDVKFTDKGGFPITGLAYKFKAPDKKTHEGLLTGQIKRTGLSDGDYEIELSGILDAQWSKTETKIGEKVKILIKTKGMEDGEKAEVQIFVKDANFADYPYETLTAEVDSDKIEIEWELIVDDRLFKHQDYKARTGRYSEPRYYFVVQTAGLRQRSGLLKYEDWIELEVKNPDGEALKDGKYILYLPNGEARPGKLDSQGIAREEKIPPGKTTLVMGYKDVRIIAD
jgi:hypothetical protein